jgi:carboxyl-terminal processing protease
LTIATYHTPSGRTPHRHGIMPDVVVPIDDATRGRYLNRFRIDAMEPEERNILESWEDPVITMALKSL